MSDRSRTTGPPSGDSWQRIRRHLESAIDLPVAEVEGFLRGLELREPDVAGEVASLVFAHRAAGVTPSFLGRPAARLLRSRAAREMPPRLGAYRLLEEIGRGGMAKVFLAERADDSYHKRVAIKVLRRGLETADLKARFRRERQILAGLDHPGIARLLDGGTTPDGRPYLVMDRVEGEPLDVYCRRRGLDPRARLELLRRVCEAVHFAHQNGVVHGDLKTTNLVVTAAGDPKLLDFGVARVLGARAAAPGSDSGDEWTPVTPTSASPEQLRGEPATTASDVYSLGLLARELLSARAAEAPAGGVDERGPAGVSARSAAARRAFRGPAAEDLANVLAKALAFRPGDRYPTAGDLASDLSHVLAGRPVGCTPSTMLSRARRAAARHRALATVAAATAAALVAFGLLSFFQARAERRRVALTQRFFEAAQQIEVLARIARLLPADQTFSPDERIRARLWSLADEVAALGPEAEVPAAYPLAVGHAALGDLEGAQRLLETAWSRGYTTSAVALALGRTLASRYREAVAEAESLREPELRRAARRRAAAELRDPALAFLEQGRSYDRAMTSFVEATIAFSEGRLAEAEAKARAAFAERPWFYDARKLEGDVYLERAALEKAEPSRPGGKWNEKAAAAFREALEIGRGDPALRESLCPWLAAQLPAPGKKPASGAEGAATLPSACRPAPGRETNWS